MLPELKLKMLRYAPLRVINITIGNVTFLAVVGRRTRGVRIRRDEHHRRIGAHALQRSVINMNARLAARALSRLIYYGVNRVENCRQAVQVFCQQLLAARLLPYLQVHSHVNPQQRVTNGA